MMGAHERLAKDLEMTVEFPYLGPLAALILLIGYGLLFIPTALTMGVGLAAKKIALATDPDSRRYQSIAQKYLTFADETKVQQNHLKKLVDAKVRFEGSTEKLKALKETLPTLAVTQNDLDSLKHGQEESIKTLSRLTSVLTPETESRAKRLNTLQTEIKELAKAYLHLKPEESFTLNLG